MRVASLPRFLHGRGVGRAHARRLILLCLLIAVFAFGAAGVAASDQSHPIDPNHPFRW